MTVAGNIQTAPRPPNRRPSKVAILPRVDSSGLEQLLCERLAAEPHVIAAYLFGSVARGESRPSSDIDVAILYATAPKCYADLPLALEADLAETLGRSVDVVVLNDAPADLTHRILRDGRLIFERDRSGRIAFEVRTRNVYFDMQPIWRRYRRLEERPP